MLKCVAEIGINHQGSIEIAKSLMNDAREVGIDFVKFQKRDIDSMSIEAFNAPHPVPANAFGPSYGLHKRALEFTAAQYAELIDYANAIGIGIGVSVYDVYSAREMAELQFDFYKIPSALNTNQALIESVVRHIRPNVGVHISFGMVNGAMFRHLVRQHARTCAESLTSDQYIVFYATTSNYTNEDVYLSDVKVLLDEVNDLKMPIGIGFSGHNGANTTLDHVALGLGARWFERHFTFDRSAKGTDHKISIMKNEYSQLRTELLGAVRQLSTYRNPYSIPASELGAAQKMRAKNE